MDDLQTTLHVANARLISMLSYFTIQKLSLHAVKLPLINRENTNIVIDAMPTSVNQYPCFIKIKCMCITLHSILPLCVCTIYSIIDVFQVAKGVNDVLEHHCWNTVSE